MTVVDSKWATAKYMTTALSVSLAEFLVTDVQQKIPIAEGGDVMSN